MVAKPTGELRLDATLGLRHTRQSFLASQSRDDGTRYSSEEERDVTSKTLQLGGQYSGIKGHTFQLNGNYVGRQLYGLFETEPNWQVHALWTWRLSPKFMLRASIRDIFDSNTITNTLNAGTVRQSNYTEQRGRVVNVALSYTFGGVSGDSRLRNNSGLPPRGGGPDGGGK